MGEVTQEQIEQIWASLSAKPIKVQAPVSEEDGEDFKDRLRRAEDTVNGLND